MSKVIAFPASRRAAFPTCGALALDPAYIEEFPQEEPTPRHDVEVIAFPGAWQEDQPEESRKTKTRLGASPKFSEFFPTTCDIPPVFYFVDLPLVDARFDWDIRAGPNYILAELNGFNQVVATYVPTRMQDDVIVKNNLQLNKTAIYSDFAFNLPTKIVRDEFGNQIETLESPEPYGAMQTASTIDHTRFQGKMLDPVTGFYYFRNRWYDPQARRFVSQDQMPIDEFQPDKIHRYAFAGLNPISNVDPMGTDHLAAYKYSQVRSSSNSSEARGITAWPELRNLSVELQAIAFEKTRLGSVTPNSLEWSNWLNASQTELRSFENKWWVWWRWGSSLGLPQPQISLADDEFVLSKNFIWAPGYLKTYPWENPDALSQSEELLRSLVTEATLFTINQGLQSSLFGAAGMIASSAIQGIRAGSALSRLSAFSRSVARITPTRVTIGGLKLELAPHAVQRMQQKGISLEQVRATIQGNTPFSYFHRGQWKTGYYDPSSRIFVAKVGGGIRTVINQVKPQYITNLLSGGP